jgi:hypothetical protein
MASEEKGMMNRKIDDFFQGSTQVNGEIFASVLEEVEKVGVGNLLKEDAGFLGRFLVRLRQAGAAKLLNEDPGAAEKLADLLWEGVKVRAESSPGLKSALQKAERKMRVNVEAADSPFRCHFVVEGGRIEGASGLLHFKDEDFRFMGPTETLLELLTWDLAMGFSNLRLQTAGHSGWVSRVSPVVRELGKFLKGASSEGEKIGSGI